MAMDKTFIRACEPRCCFAYVSERYCQRCNSELGFQPYYNGDGVLDHYQQDPRYIKSRSTRDKDITMKKLKELKKWYWDTKPLYIRAFVWFLAGVIIGAIAS
jgi:hypothetical protein